MSLPKLLAMSFGLAFTIQFLILIVLAMMGGTWRVIADFNHYGEGWLEIALSSLGVMMLTWAMLKEAKE